MKAVKVNIFAPTYHRFEMTKRCLESVIPMVESSQFDTKLFICDNNSDSEMQSWLKTLISDKVRVIISERNIGKAGIINKVYSSIGRDFDFIISLDSDLVFIDEGYNFIDEMVIAKNNNPEFGILSTFQQNNDQHLWDGLPRVKNTNNHSIAFGKFNSIAGGCIILHSQLWAQLGGYSLHGGVYGFDDGLMMQSVHLSGKLTGVIKNVRLYHPHDEDDDYRDWKRANIAKRQQKGFYDE